MMNPSARTSADAAATRGALLVNLGSPEAPTTSAVRKYLHQFLMDRYVIDVPYPLRKLIVCAFILPRRPRHSAEAYRKIWWPEGSPLVVLSGRVRDRVQELVSTPVELGMRYGRPSIEDGLRSLLARSPRLTDVLLVPLYPHYAQSTFKTVVVEFERVLRRLGRGLRHTVLPPFYEHPAYVAAMAARIQPHLSAPFDHLLFSYHGIPERHVRREDPTKAHCLVVKDCCNTASPAHERCYRAHTVKATAAIARALGLPPGRSSIAYQSRLGREPWLQPYTDHELQRLARAGVRRLLVACPSFVADCLETLEEIGLRGRDDFIAAGGRELELIPCLNDHPAWLAALAKCVETGALPVGIADAAARRTGAGASNSQ